MNSVFDCGKCRECGEPQRSDLRAECKYLQAVAILGA
jgi:hypothetical protein